MNVNDDTIKLLRECDAGVEMGIKTLDNVIDDVESDELRKILEKSRETHCKLKGNIAEKLGNYGDDGKEPAAMASFFAKVKSEVKLMSEHPDISAIRYSMLPYRQQENITNMPLYGVFL